MRISDWSSDVCSSDLFGTVHYNVGMLLNRLDRREDALVHLRRAVFLEPEREGARHLVAAIEGRTTASAPLSFVRDLFDSYAYRFEPHLVGELKYRGHHEVLDAIRSVAPDRRFALTLDLGCGTGLSGALLRSFTARLVGIDISEKMLQHADRKAVYDTLL